MKFEGHHIEQIKDEFKSMQSKEDLLRLLNYTNQVIYGEKASPLILKQLTWYTNHNLGFYHYKTFVIKKKSGAERIINAPASGLKSLQTAMNFILQCVFEPHKAAYGFVRNKSIVDNALNHTGNRYVFNLDLKDFFPSIEAGRIWMRLQHPPFNLNVECGRDSIANLIVWMCTAEMKVERINKKGKWSKVKRNVLPQGAPTSPVLSNIICHRLDYILTGLAKRFGLKYSRYADDITFSSLHNVYQKDGEFLTELKRIIIDQGFHINDSKTRLQKDGYRKEVTGLVVNDKVNVHKRYIKQLRMWLYIWEKYGYNKANDIILKQYSEDKSHLKEGAPKIENIIGGKLEYLKMVKGVDNKMYLKLFARYNSVIGTKVTKPNRQEHLYQVLNILNEKGLDEALRNYIPSN
jgi:RNA-directed DNA polymerase